MKPFSARFLTPLALALTACTVSNGDPGGDTSPNVIDARPLAGQFVSLGVDGDTVVVAYQGPGEGLYVRRSTDGGATWPDTNRVQVDPSASARTSLVHFGDAWFVSFSKGNSPAVARSTDLVTWTTTVLDDGSDSVPEVALAADLNRLVLVAAVSRDPAPSTALVVRTSFDGTTWSEAQELQTGGRPQDPGIGVFGMDIVVTFMDGASLTTKQLRSTDGGATFAAPEQLHARGTTARPVFDGDLGALPVDDGASGALLTTTDAGLSWTLATTPPGTGLVVPAGNTFHAWHQYTVDGSKNGVALSDSTDAATWPENARHEVQVIAGNGSAVQHVDVVIRGSKRYVAFFDGSFQNLKFAHSTDAGVTWSLP